MNTVLFLRDLMVDQRNGNTATFEYTTRNWKLNVYAMSIPFQDQVTATTREIEIQFKIQEDVTGSSARPASTSNWRVCRTASSAGAGDPQPVQRPPRRRTPLNPVGRIGAMIGGLAGGNGTGIPYVPSNNTNTVDTTPGGNNPAG